MQCKGIDTVALGKAAGTNKSANFRWVFRSSLHVPSLVFCTPEYLFGTQSTENYLGSSGQFHYFLENKEMFCMVAIDEAHKVFDRPFIIDFNLLIVWPQIDTLPVKG